LQRRKTHTLTQLVVDLEKMQWIAVILNNQYVALQRLIVVSLLLYTL
jgi:hypothetical protein